MQFPFSFWGNDVFAGITQTLLLTENFTLFLNAPWIPIVETLQFSEDFTPW